jgi:hypothetical protein
MWAAHAVRFNMSSLPHRQCAFPRDRTSTFINVGHNHSECALAKSRLNEHGFAVTDTLDCCYDAGPGSEFAVARAANLSVTASQRDPPLAPSSLS